MIKTNSKINNLTDQTPVANALINQIQQTSTDENPPKWYELVKPQGFGKHKGESFPLECLSPMELNAVSELGNGYGYSVELIQSQTLAAMGAAFTLCAMIEADGRESPVSVNILTIAGSSEGKTTIHDHLVSRIVNSIVDLKEEAFTDAKWQYSADIKQWEQNGKSLENRMASPKVKNHEELQKSYLEHMKKKPIKPPQWKNYRAVRGFSIQGLASRLLEFPMCVVSCDEGLEAFGSHAFKSEEINRTLGVLNSLFSGGAYDNTIKSEPVHIERCNGVVNLMVQSESFVNAFLSSRGNIAKDSGLFSRFLICRPNSIAGTIDHSKLLPSRFPCVDKFCEIIIDIVVHANTVQLLNGERYELNMPVIHCHLEAVKYWVAYKQRIEPWKMEDQGRYCRIGDKEAVGKSAELALRMAALMHILEHPEDYSTRPVDVDTMKRSIVRAEWYLHEGIRTLQYLEAEPANSLPRLYEKAILEVCRMNNATSATLTQVKEQVRNHSRALRDGEARDQAIQTLIEMNRVFRHDGKTTCLEPHPDILKAYNS